MKYCSFMRPAKKQKSYFSQRLIELRKARGLTQEQLAHELKLSIGTVAYYEAKVSNPQTSSLKTMADFFGVTIDHFLENVSKKQIKPGPMSKLDLKVEEVKKLSAPQQKLACEMLDMLIKGSNS